MSFAGELCAIYICREKAAPMQRVDGARAEPGRGLEGDRHFYGAGTYSKGRPDEEVTLIESEAIEAVAREEGIALDASETRRNLLTRGVALNHLVGREFTVGTVRLRGLRLCEPCKHMAQLASKHLVKPLLHRGGLRAQIVTGGTLRAGDAIVPG